MLASTLSPVPSHLWEDLTGTSEAVGGGAPEEDDGVLSTRLFSSRAASARRSFHTSTSCSLRARA
eukprot:4222261-Amphidinium_carterae.1